MEQERKDKFNFILNGCEPNPIVRENIILSNYCDIFVDWLEEQVFNNKMRLSDIPREIRLLPPSSGIYLYALRLSSRKYFPVERFIEDLNIITDDICSVDKQKWEFVKLLILRLGSYLDINEWLDNPQFIECKRSITERLDNFRHLSANSK